METIESILHGNGSVTLGNNERLSVPGTLRFIWEVGRG